MMKLKFNLGSRTASSSWRQGQAHKGSIYPTQAGKAEVLPEGISAALRHSEAHGLGRL